MRSTPMPAEAASGSRSQDAYRYLAEHPFHRTVKKHPRERAEKSGRLVAWVALPASRNHVRQHLPGILAEAVEHGGLVHAGNGAERRARLFGRRLTLEVGAGITLQWNCRAAALLGAVVYQPILTDIQESAAGTAV